MSEEKKEMTLEDLKKELEGLEKQRDEYLAGWQRAKADFLNYKKEEEARANALIVFVNGGVAIKLLSIIDNFELAEKSLTEELKKDDHVKGILLIKNQLLDYLKNLNIVEMKTEGQKFDPVFHEAVEQVEKKGVDPGLIVEEVRKGYLMEGMVLRPAKVKVSK